MRTQLCFHGIGTCVREREAGEASYWVGRDLFLRVLDLVVERPDVQLSFDDGNRSDADIALPALRERGLTATFFPLAGRLDDDASLAPVDIRQLRDAGMEIGNHGWHHVSWRRLDPAAAQREFVASRDLLQEAAGAEITTAALPLGQYDRRSLRGLRRAGYRRVFSSDRYPAWDRAWLSPRYSVGAADTLDSVHEILQNRPGRSEARNIAASLAKRMR